MKSTLFLIVLFVVGCASMPTQQEVEAADCGTYPDNVQAIVRSYIDDHFFDPYSVRDLVIEKPRKVVIRDAPIAGGKLNFGYLIVFSANAKNRYGAYTGKSPTSLFFQNGKVSPIDNQLTTWK